MPSPQSSLTASESKSKSPIEKVPAKPSVVDEKIAKEDDDDEVNKLAEEFQEQTRVTVNEDDEKFPASEDDDAPHELQKVAEWIRSGQVKKILVVTGAGTSVAAGIPDFRSPGTGLYDNLAKYNLPYPQAVFDISFYEKNPKPFIQLASELWPGANDAKYKPTLTHCFLALLAEKNLLLRVYTQNIDGLDHMAHVPEEKLVECHGHFRTASCILCDTQAPDIQTVQQTIVQDQEVPHCHFCEGYVKPDIVFFGQGLPERFYDLLRQDLPEADCCMILGTSLQVAPVSMIPNNLSGTFCKRVLFNREWVGDDHLPDFGSRHHGDESSTDDDNDTDVFHAGDCDDSIEKLAQLLGWQEELQERYNAIHSGDED